MKTCFRFVGSLLAAAVGLWAASAAAEAEPVCSDPMDLTKDRTINIGEGAVTNYTGLFSGGSTLTKSGLGQLVMSNGANAESFTGNIYIGMGSVRMDAEGALGTGCVYYNGNGSGKADNIHELVFNADGATVPNRISVQSTGYTLSYPAIRILKNTTFSGKIRSFYQAGNPKSMAIQDNPDGSVVSVFNGKICGYSGSSGGSNPMSDDNDIRNEGAPALYLQPYGVMHVNCPVWFRGVDMSYFGSVTGAVHFASNENDIDYVVFSRGNIYLEAENSLPGYVWWDKFADKVDQEHGSVFLKTPEVRLAGFKSDKILGDGRGQTVMRAIGYTASNPRVTITGKGLAGQTLTGAPRFLSCINVVLDAPADFTQVFQNRTHDFSNGSLTVSNGTLRLTGDFRCGGLTKLEVSGGRLEASSTYSGAALFTDAYAKTTLPTFRLNGDGQIGGTCKTITVSKFIYNGTDMGCGVFTHAACPNIDEGFAVCVDYPPSGTVAATWTGAGEDDSIQTAANWSWSGSPELPPLTGRELVATFANGGSSALFDMTAEWRGLVFDTAEFALRGTQVLQLFENGILTRRDASVEGPRVFSVEPHVEFLTDRQVVDIAEGDTVDFVGGVGTVNGVNYLVRKTGYGRMHVVGAAARPFNATLYVTNGWLEVTGELGAPGSTGGITLNNWTNAVKDAANWTTGHLILSNVHIHGAVKIERCGGAGFSYDYNRFLQIPKDTTNEIDGVMYVADSCHPYIGEGSVLRCRQGWNQNAGYLNVQNNGTKRPIRIIFDGPFYQKGATKGVGDATGVTFVFNAAGCSVLGSLANASEYTVDYVFDRCAKYNLYGGNTMNLNATKQRVDKVCGSANTMGYVTGVFPSCLEIVSGTTNPAKEFMRTVFQGEASLLMGGELIAQVTNATATTVGDVAVTNGVLEFAHNATWQYGTNVTVSGTGRLKLNRNDTFNRRFAVLHLGGTGVIEMKTGTLQAFKEGYVEDAEGNVLQIPVGTYTGAATDGVMAGRVTGGGAVKIKGSGLFLIVR